jgi:hypothetical protein
MEKPEFEDTVYQIENVIHNQWLAVDLFQSISLALKTPFVQLGKAMDEWGVFEQSLNAAIYAIEADPRQRGALFKRLLFYGIHDPDDPIVELSDGKTALSDPEY